MSEADHFRDAVAALALTTGRITSLVETLRGLSLNSVLGVELVTLDAAGIAERSASVPVASLAVVNGGTMTLVVAAGGRGAAPPAPAPGVVEVGPGHMLCFALAGTAWSFYGRPAETFLLALYTAPQSPAAGAVDPAAFFPVALPGASAVAYTAPHNRPAVFAGFSVRNTSAVASATVRFRDGPTVAGPILESISLAPSESTSDKDAGEIRCSGPSIYFELVAGAVEGSLRVR